MKKRPLNLTHGNSVKLSNCLIISFYRTPDCSNGSTASSSMPVRLNRYHYSAVHLLDIILTKALNTYLTIHTTVGKSLLLPCAQDYPVEGIATDDFLFASIPVCRDSFLTKQRSK